MASVNKPLKRISLVFPALIFISFTGCHLGSPHLSDPFALTQPKSFVARRSSSNNPDWNSNDDSKRPIPGETTVLADLQGPGVVDHIWLTVADNEYAWPRLLRFRVYYDGSDIPSVDAPLGDFFAVGHGMEAEVKSLMVRCSSQGRARNCYWPMPFKKSCKITITNEGRRRVTMLYYHVDWQKVPSLPADAMYFHARYRQALPAPPDGSNYQFLNVQGRGHYVGTVMSVVQGEAGWFGEGDDLFWVNGQKPLIEGTGTEDYFNDAWSLHVNDGPYFGTTVSEGTGLGSRMTAYRWHLTDPVPFTKSLKAEIEHRGWTYRPDGAVRSVFGERTDLISSVAFWYQEGIAKDQPPVPYGAARLPQGNALQIEVEKSLSDCKAENGKASLAPDLFWSKDVILFEGNGKGARFEVPFDVPEEGDYELYTELAQGSDYGIYSVMLDGKEPQSLQLEHEPGADVHPKAEFDGYSPETVVGLQYLLGWVHLTKGKHALQFTCVGKRESSSGYSLGVDNVILAKTGAAAWAAAATVRPPQLPSDDVTALGRLLTSNADPVVRGMAAIALRDKGHDALSALPAIKIALKDGEVGVRMMAANVIGAIGKDASSAVPDLIAVGSTPNQAVHVLRSVASALAAIGKPEACAALPMLREIAKIPRVEATAKNAIRQLE